MASVIFTSDFSSGTVVIELDCFNIEDKTEKVRTGEVFSVVNIDFCIVVLGYKEVISEDVRMGLRVVSDASFPSEGSEGREMFKEIREPDGEKDKADGFPVKMVVILCSCDLSGSVFNNVVSVPLRRASGDAVMDDGDSLSVATKGAVVVSLVFTADVVTLPEYDGPLVFTVLETRADLYSVDIFPENEVNFVAISEGDVTLTDKGIILLASAKTGYLVCNVVRSSVVFRTMCKGYPVVETVLNVFFNSPEAGEAGVGRDTAGLFVERMKDFSVLELGCGK